MEGYQLSLQGSYSARLETNEKNPVGSADSRSLAEHVSKQSDYPLDVSHHGELVRERVGNAGLQQLILKPSPARYSTACCDGLSVLREVENAVVPLQDSNCMGHSFRSEDSESLALWEEKEQPVSNENGWVKITVQSPRWLDAMRKFETVKLAPWRSSPVHPKSSLDSPRFSLDRKSSNRSLHESSKSSWYSHATKKFRSGESRSVRSPSRASSVSRQSGEYNPSFVPFSTWVDAMADDSNHRCFSGVRESQFVTEEYTRFTSSAAAWDTRSKSQPVLEKVLPVSDTAWQIPAAGPETETDTVTNASLLKSVDKLVLTTSAEPAATDASPSTAKGQPASDENRSSVDDNTSTRSGDTVRAINPVAHAVSKPLDVEEDNDSSVPSKCEAPRKCKVDETTSANEETRCESLEPPPQLEIPSSKSSYGVTRELCLLKSKSAPLDGICAIQPKNVPSFSVRNSRGTLHTPLPPSVAMFVREGVVTDTDMPVDSFLSKSKSSNAAESPLRRSLSRVDSSATPVRLFSKLRSKVFRPSRLSPFGKNVGSGEFCDSYSPRSILYGPDRESLPSSNPSLRCDPGMPTFSVLPASASQSYSSSGASFDLNEHDFEAMHPAYDLNATTRCKAVDSLRASLSFRDFGPSRTCWENVGAKVDLAAVEAAAITMANIDLFRCDDRLDTNELRSSPEPMQSPELWKATFSTRYAGDESPQFMHETCVTTERICPSSAPPPSRRRYMLPLEEERQQQTPVVVPRSRSRHSEFTSRLGGMFSPLRLPGNSRSCFVGHVLSPPHNDEDRLPACATTLEFLTPSASQSSSKQKRSKSIKRRHSSDDSPTMMTSMSKAVKKILAKCRISGGKGKSKMGSPICGTLRPVDFQFSEAN